MIIMITNLLAIINDSRIQKQEDKVCVVRLAWLLLPHVCELDEIQYKNVLLRIV
jgi:hypothetical protein